MFRPAKPEHIERSRTFRQSMTPAEVKLWCELRTLRAHGYHFRRQAPFRGYYLDFVEHSTRLVTEVDGGQHVDANHAEHDQRRGRVLARYGYKTLCTDNGEVPRNFEGVMEYIWGELVQRMDRPPPASLRSATSPQRGR